MSPSISHLTLITMNLSKSMGWTSRSQQRHVLRWRDGSALSNTFPPSRYRLSTSTPRSQHAKEHKPTPRAKHASPDTTSSSPATPFTSNLSPAKTKFFDDVHFLGDVAGKIVIRSPPVFRTASSSRLYHKQHLAAAFRVFARQGFDEGVAGHISLRDPEHRDRFWINPLSKHFSQIRVSDLVLVDDEGRVLPGGAQLPINGPAFAIHSEIHKARPDLNAACHAHSVYGKAFSTFGRVIEPIYQDAIRFYDDLSGESCCALASMR